MLRAWFSALVLAIAALVLVWAHVGIASLTVCLNETPALIDGVRQPVPVTATIAERLLPLFAPLGAASPSACDAAAPARAMAVAGLAYLTGLVVLERAAIPSVARWLVVLGAAVVVQLALFAMPALLSSDVLDYASHGRVASMHAANPYLVPPATFPTDPFAGVGAWANVVTVYGPMWTRIDAAITGLLPDASLLQIVFAYKLLALVAELASAALIVVLSRHWAHLGITQTTPAAATAAWLWNPVVNVELVGNAHNESVMIFFVLLAFALITASSNPALAWPAGASPPGVRRTGAPPADTPSSGASLDGASPAGAPSSGASPVGAWRVGAWQAQAWLWPLALLSLWLGGLIKFVPAAIEAIFVLVWLRGASPVNQRPARAVGLGLARAVGLGIALAVVSVVVAWPWLDSPAIAGPLVGVAAGGQRFKDVWQDAAAAWLTVRVVPLLGVPDDPDTLRMDVARTLVWGVTRTVFFAYVVAEAVGLWHRAAHTGSGLVRSIVGTGSVAHPSAEIVRSIAVASVRALLLVVLLYVSQVYAWYFLWPLPMACVLGIREPWSRAAIVLGLAFLPAYYLREFQSYGVFYVPIYLLIGLALFGLTWMFQRARPVRA